MAFFEGIFSASPARSEPKQLPYRAYQLAEAFKQQTPKISRSIRNQILPFEQTSLGAAKQVYPGYGNLQREISLADLAANRGVAIQDIGSMAGLSQAIDPEFYANRSALGQGSLDFLSAGSGLTGGERTEIERSLSKSKISGGGTGGSTTETVGEASQFGAAARNRFAEALNTANAIIPQLRTTLGQQPTSGRLGAVTQTQVAGPSIGSQAFASALPSLQGIGGIQQTGLEGMLGEAAPAERAMGLMPQVDY